MQDSYARLSPGLESPAATGFTVTPADDDNLPAITRALYVGEGGDLAVEMSDGTALIFKDVPTGTILPLRVRKVLEASTAAYIVGLC